jgi:molecular chaperone DnaJ
VSFEEAVKGATKKVSYMATTSCGTCNGSGAKPGTKPVTCSSCNGTGQEVFQNGFIQFAETCRSCGGSGKDIPSKCGTCRGQGVVKEKRTADVQVPAGKGTAKACFLCDNSSVSMWVRLTKIGAMYFFYFFQVPRMT